MEQLFLVIHVLIAVGLIGVVLLQRSDTDGFGLGSGSGANLMSGRQSANFMTRMTAILATLFILNSLWLGILASQKNAVSLMDQIEAVETESQAAGDTVPITVPTDMPETVEGAPAVPDIQPDVQEKAPVTTAPPVVPTAE